MKSSGLPLLTLRQASHTGWAAAVEGLRDTWRKESERISLSITDSPIRALKYGRVGSGRNKLLVSHGGPGGGINEIWRYFVNSDRSDLLLPAQIPSDDEVSITGLLDTDTILSSMEILHRACLGEPAVVAGSSWGATVSLAYAARNPSAVTGLLMSCPLLPTEKSLDFMVSPEGGFDGNPQLWEMFIEPIRDAPHETAREIFTAYRDLLERVPADSDVIRAFSALLYASSGDFPPGLADRDIPRLSMTRRHAFALAYFAMQPRPFFIDMGQVYRGLQELKRQKCTVFFVRSTSNRSSHPEDIDKIIDLAGAKSVIAVGGHSSKSAKVALGRKLSELGF